MRAANIVAMVVGLMNCVSCCVSCAAAQHAAESEVKTVDNWRQVLLGKDERTAYEMVRAFDGVTSVEGFKLWSGSYGGVRLAVYSCFVSQPSIEKEGGRPGGLQSIRLVLAAWGELKDSGKRERGGVLEERVLNEGQIDVSSLVEDGRIQPPFRQIVKPGQLRTDWQCKGKNRLVCDIVNGGVGKQSMMFDLGEHMKKFKLYSTRGVTADVNVATQLEPDAFVKHVKDVCMEFDALDWGSHPPSESVKQLESEQWEHGCIVSKLLSSSEDVAVVGALKYIRLRQWKDSHYLSRLGIDIIMVSLAGHRSEEVRGQFAHLLFSSRRWLADRQLLLALTKNKDATIAKAARLRLQDIE